MGKNASISEASITTGLKVDGGAVDTSRFLGPLICASWDPRPASCLALLSSHNGASAIVDVWRELYLCGLGNTLAGSSPMHGLTHMGASVPRQA